MAGLPHYTNAKAAAQLYEPVYLNQFEIIIQPPPAVFNPLGNQNRTLLVENVLSISGLSVDKNPGVLEQRYKFSRRRYAAGLVEDTGIRVAIEFETNLDKTNSNYVFKTLRQWADLVYNPLTGAMGIKSVYANQTYMLISIFNKQGDVNRRIKLMNCFPVDPIKTMDLDYTKGTESYRIRMSFRADHFTDVFN